MFDRIVGLVCHYWKDLIIIILLGLSVFAWTSYQAQFGLVPTDESYYLASANNLRHGEPLFMELHSGGLRNFEYFLAKVLIVFPGLTVLQFRIISCFGFAVMCMGIYALLRLAGFKRLLSAVAIVFFYTVWITALRLYDLSYLTLPFVLMPLVACLLLLAQRWALPKRSWWIVHSIAGLLIGMSCIARSTMVASILLWLICALCYRHKALLKSVATSCGIGLGLLVIFYVLHAWDWQNISHGLEALSSNVGYGRDYKLAQLQQMLSFVTAPTTDVAIINFRHVAIAIGLTILGLITLSIYKDKLPLPLRWVTYGLAIMAQGSMLYYFYQTTLAVVSVQDFYPSMIWFSMLTWSAGAIGSLAVLTIVVVSWTFKASAQRWARLYLALSCGVIVFWQILFTAQSFYIWAIYFCLPLAPLLWVWTMDVTFSHNPSKRWYTLVPYYLLTGSSLLVFCLLLKPVTALLLDNSYIDLPRAGLTTQFTQLSKLNGIYSSPENVDNLTRLAATIEAETNSGDYILSYYDMPMLYYITDTRPSVDTVWSSRLLWNDSVDNDGIRYMCNSQRFPKLIVINHVAFMKDYTIASGDDGYYAYFNDKNLLGKYFRKGFEPIAQFGTLSLFKPKPDFNNTRFCENNITAS
jgi:hypothetical protein